jgi:enediyne biosynthesis protein CalE5
MGKRDVLEQWKQGARYWERHREVIERMFAPVTRALVEAAGVAAGMTVLDVATGPGQPALTLARIVGDEGRVVGADVVPAMIEAARREAERTHTANVTFQTASAQALPFDDASFDAVVSRFGVMLFPSPLEGVREMLRVLKPGGRMALAVWGQARDNPFHFLFTDLFERHFEPEPAQPDAPDAFRFAPRGKLLAVAREAGLAQADERLLQFFIQPQVELESVWVVRTEMSDMFRNQLAQLSRERIDALQRDFCKAARPYVKGTSVSFPAEVLIVSGPKLDT